VLTANRGHDRPLVGYARSLVDLLTELRARAGSPSYREIAGRIPSGSGERTSAGYVSEVLRGKRVPSGDLAAAIARALQGDTDRQQRARRYAEEASRDKVRTSPRSAAQQRVVPRQLPAAVAHFAGRADELATLTHLARKRGGTSGPLVISAVSGTAGVGKPKPGS
jgi:hypothetical protein